MKEIKGTFQGNGIRVGIVISRFNDRFTKSLLEGALEALEQSGVESDHVTVAWVPGALEIPVTLQRMLASGNYDTAICLGCVIRGSTPHFDYVCSQANSGIYKLSLEYSLPVLNGILTTDTIEQAIERSGSKHGNKGYQVAQNAVEMVSVLKQLPLSSPNSYISHSTSQI